MIANKTRPAARLLTIFVFSFSACVSPRPACTTRWFKEIERSQDVREYSFSDRTISIDSLPKARMKSQLRFRYRGATVSWLPVHWSREYAIRVISQQYRCVRPESTDTLLLTLFGNRHTMLAMRKNNFLIAYSYLSPVDKECLNFFTIEAGSEDKLQRTIKYLESRLK